MEEKMMIHRAINFAARAHDGQLRKGSDIPYIVHPFETAQILTEAGCEAGVICAGLLHDTVEDTETTIDEIKSEFGERVAYLVALCSEDKADSWEERKEHTLAELQSGSMAMDELLLVCADKLSNLRSIAEDSIYLGEDLWKRFRRPKEMQGWYYRSLAEALKPLSGYLMYQEFCTLCETVFGESCQPHRRHT